MTRPPRMRPVLAVTVAGDGQACFSQLRREIAAADLAGEVKPPSIYL